MTIETKPICVVYLPETISGDGKKVGWGDCREMSNQLDRGKPDYHWFVLIDPNAERVEFKVFYPKDFTEIQYEELKAIIESAVNKKPNNTIP